MSRIVQEKFEVRPAQRPEGTEGNGWKSDGSARTKKRIHTKNSTGRFENVRGDLYNTLPPGMDISDQEVCDLKTPVEAGEMGTGSQATHDVDQEAFRTGFNRKSLRPTDDMYTREHNDAFYDTVEVDGVEGFVERNNYLDRL